MSERAVDPLKPTDEKRSHVVTIKLTDAEYSLLERSKAAGVKMAEYVRHGAFRLTIVSRLSEIEQEIAKGILNLSSDFNQAMTCFHQLKLRNAANKLVAVVDRMFDILKKLRPNKDTDYVCKNT
ncbi:plasmid mobilization protein [Muribaculum intestinale]|uniref:plasmid mobilization protein n=1 Tax=Muribaculum intestinale TaxID=1796646 RepID=UPI003F66371B